MPGIVVLPSTHPSPAASGLRPTLKMSEVRPPPLRALDDFLLGPARLAAPDPRDPQRWKNRVINNLLYYQSNYGLGLGLALLLGGYFRPLQTLLSGSTVTLIFVAFVWAAENKAPVRRFRRSYPGSSLLAVLGGAYGLVSLLGASEVFLLTIALPISMILLHASFRLRNLKNKIENKIESIGLKRTPMGLLLEALGQEQEAGS